MADRNAPATFTFEQWRVEFNELATDVGDIANLPATIDGSAVTDVVEAISELNTAIGTNMFLVDADSGSTETVTVGQTLTISGTANEIETSVGATDTVTIGLPNDVTVTNDLNVGGNLDVTGNITLGGNITMGDADTDSIDFNADIVSNIIPNAASTYNLGASGKEWANIYMSGTIESDTGVSVTLPTVSGQLTTFGETIALGIALG